LTFGNCCKPSKFVSSLSKSDETILKTLGHNVVYLAIPKLKSRIGFLTPNHEKVDDVLDCVKMSDLVCLLWPSDGELSQRNRLLLTIMKAHGLPSVINVAPGLSSIPIGKRREDARKSVQALIADINLTTSKLFCCDTEMENQLLLRHFVEIKKNKTILQQRRPHVLVEKLEVIEDNAGICSLLASGYLRGPVWNVNRLVHIQGWGDFQIGRILTQADPHPLQKVYSILIFFTDRFRSLLFLRHIYIYIHRGESTEEKFPKVLVVADESRREPLQSETVPDPMDAEQTWPDEYDVSHDEELRIEPRVRKVPKGTSGYQAAWILDKEGSSCSDYEDISDVEKGEQFDKEDRMEMESSVKSDVDQHSVLEEDDDMTSEVDDEDEEDDLDDVEKYRRERENAQFPDEIDTPLNDLARIRFQKYRGLKSFRTSPWDSKENLPLDYARIFQFQNYKRTRKIVLSEVGKYDSTSCVHPGQYKLIFNVGFRKFEACPIFSQHTNGDKFKMERFLPMNACCVATVFAPITFPPASVLVFRYGKTGEQELVATGSVLDVNPDRIVLKRIVLSGHPFKINKRSVVCRYMFFHREDIEWFKPIELYTPSGRRGHIKEALGTHGHMKCQFDKQLNAADSVMMSLYKRVFPKWTYNPRVARSGGPKFITQQVEDMDE
uniref:Pre-rRNA-processing protein TSR1 homolog n=1 Tax=Angiostrongylus cantonensis TaxID=6313 RepID=A0A0K0CVH5_ANGCA